MLSIAGSFGVSSPSYNDLYIIGGQSNVGDAPATGRVSYYLMPGYLKAYRKNILQYDTITGKFIPFKPASDQEWGWLVEFIYLMSRNNDGNPIYFYKFGEGGTRLAESGTGAFYSRTTLERNGQLAINEFKKYASNPRIIFLWDHGYTDGIDLVNAQEYVYNLKDFFREVRRYWKIPDLYIIFTRLSINATGSTNLTTIQSAQETVNNILTLQGYKRNFIVNTDNAPYFDTAHYSDKGAIIAAASLVRQLDISNASSSKFDNTFHPVHLNPYGYYESREVDISNTVAEVRQSGSQFFVIKLENLTGADARLKDVTTTHQPEIINTGDAAYINFVLAHSLSSTTPFLCETFCQSSWEIFFYMDLNDGQPGGLRVLFEAINGGDTISIFIDAVNKLTARIVNNVDVSAKTNVATFVNGQTGKKLINIRFDYGAGQTSIYIDGLVQALDAVSNGNIAAFSTTGFTPGQFALGNRDTYSATTGLDARLYAFGIFPLLNSTDRIKVEQYLSY